MNTDAQRRASAAFHAKREAEGYRKVTVWMAPETRADLDRLAKVYGSREKALAMCLANHSAEPVKPVTEKPEPRMTLPKSAPGSRLKKR